MTAASLEINLIHITIKSPKNVSTPAILYNNVLFLTRNFIHHKHLDST